MLYLEDYLEMIENLPMEMRDRFTEMREMDLQVQNSMDSLEDRVKKFFEKCRTIPSLKQEWKDDHFNKIKEDYHKALEDEDEKVQLTAQIYDLLERYLRKLDMELQKFKLELEADNAGITEVLEKRSLELDNPQNNPENHRGEKRKLSLVMGNGTEKRRSEPADKLLSSLATESTTPRETVTTHRSGGATVAAAGGSGSTASSPAVSMLSSSSSASTPALSYSLGTVGAGSNAAIAAAASRAIAATNEMPQGRRSASMKASYEAMLNSDSDLASSLGLSRQFSTSRSGITDNTTPQSSSQKSRNKKSTASRLQQQQGQQQATTSQTPTAIPVSQSQLAQQLQQPVVETPPPPTEVLTETVVEESTSATWQGDPIDPNEPRYCICNEVSYGDMVGCDNDDCPIEWFHYGCVGLTQAPRGKWYCPQCTVAMKRRGRR